MKKYKLLTLAFLLLPIYTISSAQMTSQTSTASTVENSTAGSAVDNNAHMQMQQGKEVRMISTIEQIDQNEINAADAVLNKTANSDVKDFANKMKSDHQQNIKDAQKLAQSLNLTMTTSPKATMLQKKGEEGVKALQSKQGKELDTAYADDMVKGHTHVLEMMNKHLTALSSNPNANSDFVSFMKDTQKMVSDHLDAAKDLQSKLQKAQ